MKILIILCIAAFYCIAGYAQAGLPSKKAKALYNRAQAALDDNNMAEAAAYLDMATREDPGYFDAWAQAGTIDLQQKEYAQAVTAIGNALKIDSSRAPALYFSYAKALAGTGRFREAIDNFQHYLQSGGAASGNKNILAWKDRFELGLQTQEQHIPFTPVNMGDSINTADPEYFPSLTVDDQTLVFTRNLRNRNEDFYISTRGNDGQWQKAASIPAPVNTPGNEGTAHISQDGRILLFAGCNRADGYGSCDIFYAVRTGSGWTTPSNIGPVVNSPYWESQPCLSADNKTLYFVSNRPGGYGGSDIYASHLQQDGRWGKPENLGPAINTTGDESSPFIHADDQTLYFASNGWPGIGDVDLFYSRRNPDGSWGKPVNLGYPINTIDHDGSLFIAADGKTAYFASERSDSRAQLDIYQFELYAQARPLQTLYVKGYVYDSSTLRHITATINLVNLSENKTVSQLTTDQDGNYLVTLPVGKDYAFNVSRPGYLFYSENFSLKGQVPNTAYHINIPLQPIAVNAQVTLRNIFFDFNKYNLLPQSEAELDRLVKLLQDNPGLKIQVNGYTDNIGQPADNLTLSRKRAQAVVDYLTGKGITPDRLTAKGFGETHPVADNTTEAGRAQNRRTTFVIVGQ